MGDVYFPDPGVASAVLGGILFSNGFVIAPVQGIVFKKLVAKLGLFRTCCTGALALGGGTILFGICADMGWHLVVALLFDFVIVVGFALVSPSLAALAAEYSPAGRRGFIQGLMGSSQQFASVVGPVVACALYELRILYAWSVGGCAALLLILPLFTAVHFHTTRAGVVGDKLQAPADKDAAELAL